MEYIKAANDNRPLQVKFKKAAGETCAAALQKWRPANWGGEENTHVLIALENIDHPFPLLIPPQAFEKLCESLRESGDVLDLTQGSVKEIERQYESRSGPFEGLDAGH